MARKTTDYSKPEVIKRFRQLADDGLDWRNEQDKVLAGMSCRGIVPEAHPECAEAPRRAKEGTLRAGFEVVNNIGKTHQRIQRLARQYLADQTDQPLDEVPWRRGTIHDWRDTWCQHMKHHLSPDQLQRAAGHSDIATTMRFYTSPSDRDADDIRRGLADSGLAPTAIGGDINLGIIDNQHDNGDNKTALTGWKRSLSA